MSIVMHHGKEVLSSAARRLLAPLGRHRVRRLADGGLPFALQEPLLGLFGEATTPEEAQVAGRVEGMRIALAAQDIEAKVYAGPSGYQPIRAKNLAHSSSVDEMWGRLLYRCARSTEAKTILEIGSSAGFSGCYLASAPMCTRFVTIEASAPLAELARTHLARISSRAAVVHGFVETVLDDILATLEDPVDLVYLDALKEPDALVACVDRLGPALGDGALLIFDDIRWSSGCWDAWKILQRRSEVSTSVDVGRFGMCVWRGKQPALREANLSRYLGWLRVQSRS